MKPRIQEKYEKEIVSQLLADFTLSNRMEVPKLKKIVINASLKEAIQDVKVLTKFQEELTLITGQKAVLTRSKKAIANFKLREGIPIGVRVTLRRAHMYEFFDRLVNVALPRVRDFKGISPKGFDGNGNFSMGIIEHVIFPEIDPNRVDKSRGFNISIETSTRRDDLARALLTRLGMPFKT